MHAVATKLYIKGSQSLWNRARSFDNEEEQASILKTVSIPLEQGKVFRLYRVVFHFDLYVVSIPLEQGKVFRL